MKHSVDLLMAATSNIQFTFRVSPGFNCGRSLEFSGSTTLSCGSREKCPSFICPAGYAQKDDAETYFCGGSKCADTDLSICCVEKQDPCDFDHSLVLHRAGLNHSNLDEQGPDLEGPAGIKFMDVFPYKPQVVDLEVNAASHYKPGDVLMNRFSNNTMFYFNFNLRMDSIVDLDFSFLTRDGKPYHVPTDFFLSWVDIDEMANGFGRETVQPLSPFKKYFLAQGSSVKVRPDETGALSFQSSDFGEQLDDPTNPKALSPLQSKRAVAFLMPANTSRFRFRLGVGPLPPSFGNGTGMGRNILLAGTSSVACDPHPTCAKYQCPEGSSLHEFPQSILCKRGPECTRDDAAVCCIPDEAA